MRKSFYISILLVFALQIISCLSEREQLADFVKNELDKAQLQGKIEFKVGELEDGEYFVSFETGGRIVSALRVRRDKGTGGLDYDAVRSAIKELKGMSVQE